MERMEKEYYNTINSAMLDQVTSVFSTGMDETSLKKVLEEKNQSIAVLKYYSNNN